MVLALMILSSILALSLKPTLVFFPEVSFSSGHSLGICGAYCIPTQYLLSVSFFVSPELSSGRDLVIQMSVRRPASAVRRPPSMVFCPEHISGSV